MALGKRRRERQMEAFVVASDLPKSPAIRSTRHSTACWRRTDSTRWSKNSALRGFPWHAAADSWRADDWVECRNGHTSIALRPFAWPR